MAGVLSKTNLVLSYPHAENRISLVQDSKFGFGSLKSKSWCLSKKKLVVQEGAFGMPRKGYFQFAVGAQMKLGYGKAQIWWEKGLQPNMKEVNSAQDLVDSLLKAGDSLVVVDFFSPGCGGCKALHPKICQLAEMNPEVQFLHVNYEEHKSMCYSLNVHVLPFFRFYRGAHGRVCSFSCTTATIQKFRAALGKHTPDRCSLGPTKGLEEKELLVLADNRDLSFKYTPKPLETPSVSQYEENVVEVVPSLPKTEPLVPLSLGTLYTTGDSAEEILVTSLR